ncbi:hypothetical protein KY342_06395 [Candidatus Woesearchaeota archaeon]|nr:hypothetical protein [Candidatus Woesearchaeota archaeon]
MVNIKLELDYLASLLVTYHTLNAPTKENKDNNSDIFKRLQVSPEERGHYLTYLLSQGVTLDKTDSIITNLFFPDVKDLEAYLSSYGKDLPNAVKNNLRAFESRFNKYFKTLKQYMEHLIKIKKKESKKIMDSIYDTADEIINSQIKRPAELEVRVVEGLAPISIETKDKKAYVIMQLRDFLSLTAEDYLITLIHESVAHKIVKDFKHYYKGILEGYAYQIEEGFAKLFTEKIGKKILNKSVDYSIQPGTENLAYKVFNRNWERLKEKNFADWYKYCLIDISNQSSSR